MKILVNRFASSDDATLSKVLVNDFFECYGLEDEYRKDKIANETRIPAGTYEIKLRTEGGFHNRHKKLDWCKDWHRGMLWLQDVPGFEWIYIHPGNTADHTSGCLLVGDTMDLGAMIIGNSRTAYERIYKLVTNVINDEEVVITLVDNDRDHQMELDI